MEDFTDQKYHVAINGIMTATVVKDWKNEWFFHKMTGVVIFKMPLLLDLIKSYATSQHSDKKDDKSSGEVILNAMNAIEYGYEADYHEYPAPPKLDPNGVSYESKIKQLICADDIINFVDINGLTPLYFAVPDVKLVKLLLDNGANPNCGSPPLMRACREGSYECAELLLQAGASPSVCDENGYKAIFHIVVEKKRPDLLKLLLAYRKKTATL